MRSIWIACMLLMTADARAEAESPHIDVILRCPASQGTGRVRCNLEIAIKGETIPWADAVVRSTPPFATPLRGRLAPGDAVDSTPDRWRWEFALAARTRGRGDVAVTVRAVVCSQGLCKPVTRDVSAPLVVGE